MNSPIREVWAHNLEQELHLMSQIIEQEKHLYCSVDTEFPGIVLSAPEGRQQGHWDRKWTEMRSNVDVLQLIQVGFALSDEQGKPPPGCGCWQFNFKFDLSQDLHATDSIQLLQKAGCDFRRHRSDGICPYRFGELLYSSGLALHEDLKWISFHGGYDFAYLVKALSGAALPDHLDDMLEMVALFFPKRCDIKYLLKDSYHGGLQDLARQLGINVSGAHQAGVDAILTRDVFFNMVADARGRAFDVEREDLGALHGLGGSDAFTRRKSREVPSPWAWKAQLMRESRQSTWNQEQYGMYRPDWVDPYWGGDGSWAHAGAMGQSWDTREQYRQEWSGSGFDGQQGCYGSAWPRQAVMGELVY